MAEGFQELLGKPAVPGAGGSHVSAQISHAALDPSEVTARGRVGRGPETGLIGKRRQRCGAVAPSRDLKRLEEIGFGQINT
jgi:hypothetical protein